MSSFGKVQPFNYNTHLAQDFEKYPPKKLRDDKFRHPQDRRVFKASQPRFTQDDLRAPPLESNRVKGSKKGNRNDQGCISGPDDRRISVVHKSQRDQTLEPIKTNKRPRDEIEEGESEAGKIYEDPRIFKRQKRDTIDPVAINKKITNAKSIGEIVAICRQHLNDFDHINISTALHRIAQKSKTEEVTNDQRTYVTNIGEQVSLHLESMDSRHLANTAWACATLKIRSAVLFASLAKEAMYKMEYFNSQAIGNTAWAYATLNIKDEGLFASLSKEAMHKVRGFNSQNIANTAWAYAVLDLLNPEFLKALVDRLECSQIRKENLMQLKYVHLHVNYEKTTTLFSMPGQLLSSLLFITSEKTVSSELHRDVSEHLRKLNIKYRNEESINNIIVDIAIPEKKIVMEINGPSHYCSNSRDPLGATQFKMRLLLAMGWKAITIPYWDWDALSNSREKNHYLQSKLESTGLA